MLYFAKIELKGGDWVSGRFTEEQRAQVEKVLLLPIVCAKNTIHLR